MLKILLMISTISMMAAEMSEENVQPLNNEKSSTLSTVGYYGTGLAAFYCASLVLFNKCEKNNNKMISVIAAGLLGSWLFKETFRDMGLTWVDLKKELNEFKTERDAYADYMETELNLTEKNLGEIAQAIYLFPKYYWREMISFSGAIVLFNFIYRTLSQQSRILRVR